MDFWNDDPDVGVTSLSGCIPCSKPADKSVVVAVIFLSSRIITVNIAAARVEPPTQLSSKIHLIPCLIFIIQFHVSSGGKTIEKIFMIWYLIGEECTQTIDRFAICLEQIEVECDLLVYVWPLDFDCHFFRGDGLVGL